METTKLPPGVNRVGDTGTAAVPAGTAPAASPATPDLSNQSVMADGSIVNTNREPASTNEKWDVVPIAIGVVVLTLSMFMVYYFREQAHSQSEESRETNRKIRILQSDMGKVKEVLVTA